MSSSTSSAPWIWMHIHIFFMILILFGLVAALLWLYKHAGKKDFLNVVWITLGLGALGAILTASMAMLGMGQMMRGDHGDGERWDEEEYMDEMMGGDELPMGSQGGDEMMDIN